MVEVARGLKEKKCISTGVPYIDLMFREKNSYESQSGESNRTVLVAPSWGPKCFVNHAGIGFIDELICLGYKIIFRPHPQSVRIGEKYLTNLQNKFKGSADLVIDYSPSPVRAMASSFVLISDLSAIRLDYVVLFKKCVMTVLLDEAQFSQIKNNYEIEITGTAWEEGISEEIGRVIRCSELNMEGVLAERLRSLKTVSPQLEGFARQHYPYASNANRNVVEWISREVLIG